MPDETTGYHLQVAGSSPAGASISWTRSSADRAGRFTIPRRHGRNDMGKRPGTILVLREWGCGFEACSVVTSHCGGPAGSFRLIADDKTCSGECRAELQPPKLDGLAGSTPPGHTLSGTSGAIRFRPPSSPLQPRQMPTGLQVEQPAKFWRGVSDVQIIPQSQKGMA